MQLEFVSPEEAATWPEGTLVMIARTINGEPSYSFSRVIANLGADQWGPYTHFARLPDSLPEVEE